MKLTVKDITTLFPDHTIRLAPNTEICGVTQDTRKIKKGEMYVAIRGENHDGHDFIQTAFAQGANLALVDRRDLKGDNLIYCDDTVVALGTLAKSWRARFDKPVIAITGSSGKTTVKEMVAHVLSMCGKVVATRGNLNNHIGVPLTLLSFDEDVDFFVVEMGMNHAGEIAMLTDLAKPTHGLITSVGRAHVEFFDGKIENVAKAKGELFAGLKREGVALVNADDPLIAGLSTSARVLSFGLSGLADVRASDVMTENQRTKFILHHGARKYPVSLSLFGLHQVRNALAAFAVGASLGLPESSLIQGLESFDLKMNRGRLVQHKNLIIVDDTYNANPDSMRVALEALKEAFPQERKIAVLGGMLELGVSAAGLHHEVGACAKKLKFERVYAYGAESRNYLAGFGIKGPGYEDHLQMAHEIVEDLRKSQGQVVVLIKGSRGMRMEKVLEEILRSY